MSSQAKERTRTGTQARRQSHVEVVGTGERIPVPNDPTGERAAVAAHPTYKRMRAAVLRESAEGRTIPLKVLRQQMDAEDAAERGGSRPTGRRPSAANGKVLLRLPLSIHQELIERAEVERTSLNQLVLAYVSRGLGQDEGSSRP